MFDRYAGYPWVWRVLAVLPERTSYIGERADLDDLIAAWSARPEAAFLLPAAEERLAIRAPFDSYSPLPPGLSIPR